MAVGHLYARGYEEIWIAVPFANSAPVEMLKAHGAVSPEVARSMAEGAVRQSALQVAAVFCSQ